MLDGDQKDQKFVGSDIEDDQAGVCTDILNRTWIEVPRQDQWNPQVSIPTPVRARADPGTGFM